MLSLQRRVGCDAQDAQTQTRSAANCQPPPRLRFFHLYHNRLVYRLDATSESALTTNYCIEPEHALRSGLPASQSLPLCPHVDNAWWLSPSQDPKHDITLFPRILAAEAGEICEKLRWMLCGRHPEKSCYRLSSIAGEWVSNRDGAKIAVRLTAPVCYCWLKNR